MTKSEQDNTTVVPLLSEFHLLNLHRFPLAEYYKNNTRHVKQKYVARGLHCSTSSSPLISISVFTICPTHLPPSFVLPPSLPPSCLAGLPSSLPPLIFPSCLSSPAMPTPHIARAPRNKTDHAPQTTSQRRSASIQFYTPTSRRSRRRRRGRRGEQKRCWNSCLPSAS